MINKQLTPKLVITVCVLVLIQFAFICFIDRPLSLYLREMDLSHHEFINFFRAYTDVGLGLWYLLPSGIAAIIAGLSYFLKKPAARTQKHKKLFYLFSTFFISVAASGLFNNIIKIIVGRARPKLLQQSGIYDFHPFVFGTDWHSFPSGHTTNIFAVAMTLSILFPRMRWPALIIATAVGLSRVMINAHYLGDVFAGALIGLAVPILMQRVFTTLGQRYWDKTQNY